MLVKICTVTRIADARAAQEAGADCFGVMLEFPPSPRSVAEHEVDALVAGSTLPLVLVSVNHGVDRLVAVAQRLHPLALQLHGDEPPAAVEQMRKRIDCEIWKVLHVAPGALQHEAVTSLGLRARNYSEAGCHRIMIDTRLPAATDARRYGGTGTVSDWNALATLVAELSLPVVLSGGLTPENVAHAIAAVQPSGVDCSSGVEASPGIKDPAKIRAFVASARRADTSRKSR